MTARSRLLPAIILLATLTAFALLAAAVTLCPPTPRTTADPGEAANRAAVRSFYDAVNATVATGDPSALAAVLALSYAERDAAGAVPSGREELERMLRALHAVAPGLRVEAEALVADRDRVVALVRTTGSDRGGFLGLALDAAPAWGTVDVFRVVDGRVAERVYSGGRPALLEPLAEAPVPLALPGQRVVTVARVSLEPGGWRRSPGIDGLRVLVVEAGTVAVREEAASPSPVVGDTLTLGAGQWRVLGDAVAYAVRNPGPQPAVLLEIGAGASAATRGAAAPAGEGAARQVLAGGPAASVPTGPAIVAVGRATLPPGGRLAWTGPAGPVVIVVEAGSIDLALDAAAARVRRATGGVDGPQALAMLSAGDGVLMDAGAAAEVRNAGGGPLELLVVMLRGA